MIIIYWKDLLLKSRIKEFALGRGLELQFAKSIQDIAAIISQQHVKRLVVDLSAGVQLADSFAAILTNSFESIGVISHVDLETEKAALSAGFSKVIPRSVLVRDLDSIIAK